MPKPIHAVMNTTSFSLESPMNGKREETDNEDLYNEQYAITGTIGEDNNLLAEGNGVDSGNEEMYNETDALPETTRGQQDEYREVVDTDKGPEKDEPLTVKRLSDNPNFVDTLQ